MRQHNMPSDVEEAFADFPVAPRAALLSVREAIFQVAASNPVIGSVHETLKWGEPAYLTPETKSGSTIRLAWKPAQPDMCGIYLSCNTTLISKMRDIYPGSFSFQGNRAALFPSEVMPPVDVLGHCIEMALTYHSAKKRTATV